LQCVGLLVVLQLLAKGRANLCQRRDDVARDDVPLRKLTVADVVAAQVLRLSERVGDLLALRGVVQKILNGAQSVSPIGEICSCERAALRVGGQRADAAAGSIAINIGA